MEPNECCWPALVAKSEIGGSTLCSRQLDIRFITELGSEIRHCELVSLMLDIRRRSLNLGVTVSRALSWQATPECAGIRKCRGTTEERLVSVQPFRIRAEKSYD